MRKTPRTHCFRGHELSPQNTYTRKLTGRRYCRLCKNARKKENPNKHTATTLRYQMKKRYGITPEARQKLIDASGGKCAICHRFYKKPFIDHCHVSNKVRDTLCRSCNLVLGFAGDNQEILLNAVEYLRKHQGEHKLWQVLSPQQRPQEPSPSMG